MQRDRTAFFIRAYNDVDHFVPLIAEFIKKKENPLIVLTTDLDFENDYRVKYLKTLGDFEIFRDKDHEFIEYEKRDTFLKKLSSRIYSIKRNRNGFFGSLYRRLYFDCEKELNFLRNNNISECVFEWCSPFERGEILEKYFTAAKGIGLKTISIPHGCNIFINSDVTLGYRANTVKGKEFVDPTDRKKFDYYVLQNPIRRDGWIKWGYDPIKTQAWGSLRFYPDWAKINKEICPKFDPKLKNNNKLKVVFMQFQKDYNVHNKMVMDSLRELSKLEFISLAVKDATREGKAFYNRNKSAGELGDALIGWYGNEVHSPSLINWADCVIVIGGSIGIEAMLQEKHLVYPIYLNSNQTMYEYFDAAHCPDSLEKMKDLLGELKSNPSILKPTGIDKMLKEIVYAGGEPFNVPLKYYEIIKDKNLRYGKDIFNQ
tara:strand:- start:187 stop:1473 length:1287 start_codon:yes stop_codon:yes gene_type:complete